MNDITVAIPNESLAEAHKLVVLDADKLEALKSSDAVDLKADDEIVGYVQDDYENSSENEASDETLH